jgi:hypothetical protein
MGLRPYLAVPDRGIEGFLIKEHRRISPGHVPRYPQSVLYLLKIREDFLKFDNPFGTRISE